MLIAMPYPTMTFLPLLVAEEKGFFAGQDVNAYCVQVQTHGGQTLAQLVDSGEVGFSHFFDQRHGGGALQRSRDQVSMRHELDEISLRGAA
jgi:hypothetical protein